MAVQEQNPMDLYANLGKTFSEMMNFWENPAKQWNDIFNKGEGENSFSNLCRYTGSLNQKVFDVTVRTTLDTFQLACNGGKPEDISLEAYRKLIREFGEMVSETAAVYEIPAPLFREQKAITDQWVGLSEKRLNAFEQGMKMQMKTNKALRDVAIETFSVVVSAALKGKLFPPGECIRDLAKKNGENTRKLLEETGIKDDLPRWIDACSEMMIAAGEFYRMLTEKAYAGDVKSTVKTSGSGKKRKKAEAGQEAETEAAQAA